MGVGARRTRETAQQRQARTQAARAVRAANAIRRQEDPEAAADWILAQAARVAPLGPAQRERVLAALSASAMPAPGGGLRAQARRSAG